MEYRLIALGLKLALVAFVTGVAGFGVWVAGAVAVTSFWVGSDIANSMNAVFSFGLVGGIAAAWIGPRANGSALLEAAGAASAIASATVGAWLGSLHLAEVIVKPGVAWYGPPGIGEVVGAVAGALLGALAVPVAVGAYRISKRLEP